MLSFIPEPLLAYRIVWIFKKKPMKHRKTARKTFSDGDFDGVNI